MSPAPSQPADLPQPSALIDVLTRLTDPAVPGNNKLTLVEGATAADAKALDGLVVALRDNKQAPLTFAVTDIAWSEQRGYLVATVTITPADPAAAPFTYPMEFKPLGQGWQLSRETADLLLEFGG
ncbi:hypothetical protein [Mycolicibacterium mengxianglii]|uniref:hypothetical protein n=1 Tax=Mycolicibacterium mengxianglii TaxID=2736649 RepID=UPI001E30E696|nr:hypothetical protein [Mycolicibacterium mengxianglii]